MLSTSALHTLLLVGSLPCAGLQCVAVSSPAGSHRLGEPLGGRCHHVRGRGVHHPPAGAQEEHEDLGTECGGVQYALKCVCSTYVYMYNIYICMYVCIYMYLRAYTYMYILMDTLCKYIKQVYTKAYRTCWYCVVLFTERWFLL